jgi:hypothetical protein
MAAIVALRTLFVRMGVSAAAALHFTDTEGINTIEEAGILQDEDVERLCAVTRKPGGTMPAPAGAAAGAVVPNPGIPVSMIAQKNLTLLCYYLRYLYRTSRTPDSGAITLAVVRTYESFREQEKNHVDAEPPTLNDKDWPRTLENIQNWFRGLLGQTHIPLAYVIRPDTELDAPPEAGDPTTNYATKVDELIRRAPIVETRGADGAVTAWVAVYLSDRATVWNKLDELTRDHPCRTYIRKAARTRDGRMAYQLLWNHYLGKNNVNQMAAKAEHILKTTTYNGETRHWDFERYVRRHVDQHLILEGLVQHGYSGIDEGSKVRHLTAGIKTNTLEAAMNLVTADNELQQDFNRVVNLFQDVIRNKLTSKPTGRDVTIAALRTDKNGNPIEPDMTVEDMYYNNKEYNKLSAAQKLGLDIKREQRGHKPSRDRNRGRGGGRDGSGRGGRGGGRGNDKIDLSSRSIKALKSLEKTLKSATDTATESTDNDDGSAEEENESQSKKQKTQSNRENPALRRQGILKNGKKK